ncbi:MAG TPA: cupin domain-containing protein [Thiobacillus sp.]|nr:MAG: cupin [Hydrogenophilales bacterium 28-61-11]OYZ56866.1 MAG: cupin [Hydrogenophilales bacterium 16-61-112]OZA42080.1 MAG: cupin [Hydrogenophilales bacterium 17-61-76]HQT31373.1 cupin domain-containing protein [Thiobacillus sp.]HQT70762.1 cupin domain-containing protein [Thiobacillus sp.]
MTQILLGGLSPARFLRDYWHKRPLLIRNAVPGFNGLLSPAAMQELATRGEIESRLIQGSGNGWQFDHGPFKKADFKRLPKTDWTLLVQSLNHVLPAADALLARFNFIPHARLDDLMVSYAVPGGSVGPHFDSYDVFLLQGQGHRRWQISEQTDLSILDDVPIKILRNFQPEEEWLLGPGDMLYLPPHVAHYGIAEDACMTYSIGFRAPTTDELVQGFLMHVQDSVALEGRYADPNLRLQAHPGEISRAMLAQIERMIARIQWDKRDIAEFAGRYLSEPKPNVFFDPPVTPLSFAVFKKHASKSGVALHPKSRLLFIGGRFFINGEAFDSAADETAALRQLADQLRLATVPVALRERFYDWYEAGWLEIASHDSI